MKPSYRMKRSAKAAIVGLALYNLFVLAVFC